MSFSLQPSQGSLSSQQDRSTVRVRPTGLCSLRSNRQTAERERARPRSPALSERARGGLGKGRQAPLSRGRSPKRAFPVSLPLSLSPLVQGLPLLLLSLLARPEQLSRGSSIGCLSPRHFFHLLNYIHSTPRPPSISQPFKPTFPQPRPFRNGLLSFGFLKPHRSRPKKRERQTDGG